MSAAAANENDLRLAERLADDEGEYATAKWYEVKAALEAAVREFRELRDVGPIGPAPREPGLYAVIVGGRAGKPPRLSVCEVRMYDPGDEPPYPQYAVPGMGFQHRPGINWVFYTKPLRAPTLPSQPERWKGINGDEA